MSDGRGGITIEVCCCADCPFRRRGCESCGITLKLIAAPYEVPEDCPLHTTFYAVSLAPHKRKERGSPALEPKDKED